MNHIKTFENFSINEENKLREFFFGKSEDNDAVNEIIRRLEKVTPLNNPYKIDTLDNDKNYKIHEFSGYIIHFDDVDVETTYYQWSGPGGGSHNEYTINIIPKDDNEYESLDVRLALRKKLFYLVDRIYKEQNKKPSIKNSLSNFKFSNFNKRGF